MEKEKKKLRGREGGKRRRRKRKRKRRKKKKRRKKEEKKEGSTRWDQQKGRGAHNPIRSSTRTLLCSLLPTRSLLVPRNCQILTFGFLLLLILYYCILIIVIIIIIINIIIYNHIENEIEKRIRGGGGGGGRGRERDFAGIGAAHAEFIEFLGSGEAGHTFLNDKGCYSMRTFLWLSFSINDEDIRVRSICYPKFISIQNIFISFLLCFQSHGNDIRSRSRLAHRQ